jgi:hypothetical protein
VSPSQLEQLFPYNHRFWRGLVYAGKIKGSLKPGGPRGRLLIPLAEAKRILREGVPPPSPLSTVDVPPVTVVESVPTPASLDALPVDECKAAVEQHVDRIEERFRVEREEVSGRWQIVCTRDAALVWSGFCWTTREHKVARFKTEDEARTAAEAVFSRLCLHPLNAS